MDNEKIATSELSLLISRTDRLQSFINDGDREPHWDGCVHVFSEPAKKETQSIGRVPVQVKGISKKRFHIKNPAFKVRISDLKQYLEEGGAIYVVGVISASGSCELFYQTLLPYDLKRILKNRAENQQSKSISLIRLPTNPVVLENLFCSFLQDRKVQLPFISSPDVFTLEQLQENYKFSEAEFSINYFDFNGKQPLPGLTIQYPHYLYASFDGYSKVPIARMEELYLESEHCTIDEPVSCDGSVFYNSYEGILREQEYEIQIGKCFRYILSREDETSEAKFVAVGTMAERIHATNFLIAATENRGFYAGRNFFALDGDIEEIMESKAQLRDFAKQLSNVQNGLSKVGFANDLDMDKISPNEWRSIRKFALDILDDKPIPLTFDPEFEKIAGKQSRTVILTIAPLKLALICRPVGGGKFECKNLFNAAPEVEMDGIRSPVLPYFLINPESLLSVDNLNCQEMIDSLDGAVYNRFSDNRAVPLLLTLLKTYDNTGEQMYLQAADKLSSWILKNNSDNSDPIHLLNRYQTILRQRPLYENEMVDILEVAESSNILEQNRIGAYLLLGNYPAAKIHLKRLSDSEQKEFMSYPIFHFSKEIFSITQ